jgi:hypothetical protein
MAVRQRDVMRDHADVLLERQQQLIRSPLAPAQNGAIQRPASSDFSSLNY